LLPLAIALATLALTAALRPGIAGRALEAAARRLRIHLEVVLEGRQLAALVAVNAVGWLGTGTAVYLLVTEATGDPPPFLWLVGSYTAAYLVGFVAPLAPGGLGVREGMLVVLLGPSYGLGVAVAISLAIRLANVAGELLAVALVHGAYGAHALAAHLGRMARVDGLGSSLRDKAVTASGTPS
ncbi:MAG TPA: lysylphosphatidylglycerol synthase domain-containing protein, partial [Gaiellaceae bacterium]|nr:lysylphosphatidylglycerol synthase domain-containing protein [Gaiellaceae bacterium]